MPLSLKQLDRGIAGYLRHPDFRPLPTEVQPSILREETFASAVDAGYGCVSREDSIKRRMRQPPYFFSR